MPSPEPVVADASGALTDVDAVIDGFGTPDAHPIRHAAPGEARPKHGSTARRHHRLSLE